MSNEQTIQMNKHPILSACAITLFALGAANPVAAQSLGGLLKRVSNQVKQNAENTVSNKVSGAVTQSIGNTSSLGGSDGRNDGDRSNRGGSGTAVAGGSVPDDSPAARDAAIARLRAAAPRPVCDDASTMSRTYGSLCNGREFPAPPMLTAPKIAWQTQSGWWCAWSPLLVGNLMLTGSCNNDTNAGLSALDTRTGKTVWRIADICRVGNRRGTTGAVGFFELPSGQVLMVYPRDDGGPTDYYVVDVKAGRIVRSLKPAVNATIRGHGGGFIGVNQSQRDGVSYLIGLNPALDKLEWRNGGFRLAMRNDDPHYTPTFAAPAISGGIEFLTARSKDQSEPATRQLHAIDLRTGQTLWRHQDQPVVERSNTTAWRSDDGIPLVAGGKVVIRVQGLLGAVGIGRKSQGDALRALDPRSGKAAWTTRPVPGASINNRVAVGDMLVVEVDRDGARELWGYRLADGSLAWRRPVNKETRLLASAGGVFQMSERIATTSGKSGDDFRLQGLDGATGTLLWTTTLPGHNNAYDDSWGIQDARINTNSQGANWRIGRDGAVYGVTLTGAYKLQ